MPLEIWSSSHYTFSQYTRQRLAHSIWCIPLAVSIDCLANQSCLTLCNPLNCHPPGSSVHGDSPGKNTGVCCHALLQGIFPTLGVNSSLLHRSWILYHLSHQGSPYNWLHWFKFKYGQFKQAILFKEYTRQGRQKVMWKHFKTLQRIINRFNSEITNRFNSEIHLTGTSFA